MQWMSILQYFQQSSSLAPPEELLPAPQAMLIAFTDGSCLNNGSRRLTPRAGWAAVFPHHPEHTASAPLPPGPVPPTNNRAELMGCIRALEIAQSIDPLRTRPLTLHTDSEWVIHCMTKWIQGWKRNGWKKADKTPVLNQDLLQRLDALRQERPTTFKHVAAHTGQDDWASQQNAKADLLAREAAETKIEQRRQHFA